MSQLSQADCCNVSMIRLVWLPLSLLFKGDKGIFTDNNDAMAQRQIQHWLAKFCKQLKTPKKL